MTTGEAGKITARIAEHLRAESFARRVTQGAIAARAGVSRGTVNEYLNGHTPIPLPAYLDICAAIGLDPNDVLTTIRDEIGKQL